MAYRRCEDCGPEESCEVRRVFAAVAESTRALLDKATLADAIAASLPEEARSVVAAA